VLEQVRIVLTGVLLRPEVAQTALGRAQAVTVGFDDGDLERIR
jgi:hypothetical protein